MSTIQEDGYAYDQCEQWFDNTRVTRPCQLPTHYLNTHENVSIERFEKRNKEEKTELRLPLVKTQFRYIYF